MQEFQDKTVLVTGGATGIGRAAALAFANAGAAVMIGDVDERAGETAEIIKSRGGSATYQPTDVTDRSQVDSLLAKCVNQYGRVHAAFNNAGILPPPTPFHEVTESNFDRTIAVDLKGVFNCMQAEISHFLENDGGVILNTASIAGVIADPQMAPYVAAKHAVVGLTKAAAIEYARQGIRINALAPGLVRTPMTEPWFQDEEFISSFLEASPIGRGAAPEEMCGMILHLCSDAASFTTGQTFIVDGAQTAH
ncbi:glucose 1-dehydrogenase [Emcibacter sp.]|uniref:SDR family NAD(P)-dependent oxidoreductase n=1 Tax=Emcibacter sp. TaxID=1979954 RepID=UPI002AA75916|nr:glucose 1-dehydrogenase [Emcibacter sp.]